MGGDLDALFVAVDEDGAADCGGNGGVFGGDAEFDADFGEAAFAAVVRKFDVDAAAGDVVVEFFEFGEFLADAGFDGADGAGVVEFELKRTVRVGSGLKDWFAIVLFLVMQAVGGPGDGLEAARFDGAAAIGADAVGSVVEAGDGFADERVLFPGGGGLVEDGFLGFAGVGAVLVFGSA